MPLPKGDLRQIPGIGPNMAEHLNLIGIDRVEQLAGRDPEALYRADCDAHGCHVDRCVLYVYRLAVYYAENEAHEAEKLKWWNWK